MNPIRFLSRLFDRPDSAALAILPDAEAERLRREIARHHDAIVANKEASERVIEGLLTLVKGEQPGATKL